VKTNPALEALRRHCTPTASRGDGCAVVHNSFNRGDHVTTPDGNGVVLMPETPGWDRLTVLVRCAADKR